MFFNYRYFQNHQYFRPYSKSLHQWVICYYKHKGQVDNSYPYLQIIKNQNTKMKIFEVPPKG